MLIFDSFPSLTKAAEFGDHVRATFGDLEVAIFTSEERSQLCDPIPCLLRMPTVLIERSRKPGGEEFLAEERRIRRSVKPFLGRFCGT